MNRRAFGWLALASLLPAGCDLFGGTKKTPLPGERIPVLGLDSNLEPDAKLMQTAVKLPAPVVNPDWPEPGGYPNHAMYHLALPAKIGKAWEVSVGDGSSRYARVMSQPVIANGRVYAMDGGVQVSALDARNGHRVWQVDLKPEKQRGNGFGGGPAWWKDRLYVATGYAQVLALDPATGKVIWRKDATAPIHCPPTVSDGRVFVVTVENELEVLSTEDGRRLWTHNGIPETAGLLGGASPAVEGEVVIVAYNSGELYALRVENGRAVWSDNLASARTADAVSNLAGIHGRPIIDRGRVYAVGHSGRMAAIDLRSGARIWEQAIASSHSPWVAGDYLFILANDNEVACLSRNEGKVRWIRPLPRYQDEKKKSDPIVWAGPVLGGDRLIVLSSRGDALSLSPYTGAPLGHVEMSASGYLGPVIANEALYLLTDNANLSAYR